MISEITKIFKCHNDIKITKDINNNLITDDGFLIPIDYTEGGAITDIIYKTEQLMEKYEEYNNISTSNKIKNILVYGNIKEPLFQVSYIYPYIHKNQKDITNLPRYMLDFTDDLYAKKSNIVIGCMNGKLIKNSGAPAWLFTETGLMKAMFMGKSDFCKEFQRFVVVFLKIIRQTEREAYENAMNTAIKEQTERIAVLEKKTFNNQNYINYKNQLSEAISTDCIDMLGNAESQELNILRSLYYKKQIDVYIVNPEYIKKPNRKPNKEKKEFGQLSSDDELFDELKKNKQKKSKKKIKQEEFKPELIANIIEYDDDFNSYNLMNLKDVENNEFYFYLQNSTEIKKDKSNFNFIHTLNFHTKEHYDMFIKKIATPENLTHIKKMYKLTYDTIISFRSSTFNKLHITAIHEKIKKDNNITNDSKYELL